MTPTTEAPAAADYNLVVHMGKTVFTPDGMKAGETVQFSSTDGQIKIQFLFEWPFQGPRHDILGSEVEKPGELSTSEILTLVAGASTEFKCLIKPSDFVDFNYGGEVKPR